MDELRQTAVIAFTGIRIARHGDGGVARRDGQIDGDGNLLHRSFMFRIASGRPDRPSSDTPRAIRTGSCRTNIRTNIEMLQRLHKKIKVSCGGCRG
jgi:hypothetical protein